jgi:hypothetical protein
MEYRPFEEEGDNRLWQRIFDGDGPDPAANPDQLIRDISSHGPIDTGSVWSSEGRGTSRPFVELDLDPVPGPDEPAYDEEAAGNQAEANEPGPPVAAGGDDGNEPPAGPIEAPPAGDDPERPEPADEAVAAEIAEAEQLIRDAAEQVVTVLERDQETGPARSLVLRDLAEAMADADGPEAGRTFLQNTETRLGVSATDMVDPWTGLYAKGDALARTEARRAIARASEEITHADKASEGVELGGLRSAERMVALVEAGDRSNLAAARIMASNVLIVRRAELLARLYNIGDYESFEPALQAARDAKMYSDRTGGLEYFRSERALATMARAAVARNQPYQAARLINNILGDDTRAVLHGQLFKHGHRAALQPALRYMDEHPDTPTSQSVQRELAEGGYGPAREAIVRRVAADEAAGLRTLLRLTRVRDLAPRLADLTTLHRTGDPTAADKVVRLVRSSSDPYGYGQQLTEVGRQNEAAELAREHYRAAPTVQHGRQVLETTYDAEVWRSVFSRLLHQNFEILQAAWCVRYLGERVRTLRQLEDTENS